MKILTLNIGLHTHEDFANNRDWHYRRFFETTSALMKIFDCVVLMHIEEGIYQDRVEKTLVVSILITEDKYHINVRKAIETLCFNLDQDCIAAIYLGDEDSFEELIYNPKFGGEKLTFDSDYFIPYDTNKSFPFYQPQ